MSDESSFPDSDYVGSRRPGARSGSAPQRSAGMIVTGIVLLVIGQIVVQIGQQQALEFALSGASAFGTSGTGSAILDAVLVVIGVIVLIVGVHRAATSVDYLAAREYGYEREQG